LIGFDLSRREDGICASYDSVFGTNSILRFGITAETLYSAEGVEGHRKRYVEPVFEMVSGYARQPIMRMDGINWPPFKAIRYTLGP
jgi:hypothetical protein